MQDRTDPTTRALVTRVAPCPSGQEGLAGLVPSDHELTDGVFRAYITRLAEAFDARAEDARQAVYADALARAGLTDVDMVRAVDNLIATRVYPGLPRVGELVAAAEETRPRRERQESEADRLKRGALARGFVPVNWPEEDYKAECERLGITPNAGAAEVYRRERATGHRQGATQP